MKPILYLENDMHPEYIRLAKGVKKAGGTVIAVQYTLFADSKKSEEWVDLINAHTKFPHWIPLIIRKKLVWLRKWIGHIYKYKTLRAGKSSYVLRRGCSGLRDCDFQTYLCEEQKKIFIENGVNPKKLVCAPVYFKKKDGKKKKIITIVIPSENDGGIDRETGEFIKHKQQMRRWNELIVSIADKYPKYKIYLKLHPNTRNPDKFIHYFDGLFRGEWFVDRKYAQYCIDEASIIIGLPPSFSTLLYQASIEYPKKKIISLDVGNEMFGDYFKGYKNIKLVNKL